MILIANASSYVDVKKKKIYCEKHKEFGILILPENEKEQVLVVGNLAVEF